MKMHHLKAYIFILILILINKGAISQTNTKSPDAISRFKPGSIQELANEIKKKYPKDDQRITAVYQWITHNIRYDLKQANTTELSMSQQTITEKTFRLQKAVCEGYAGLMDSISELLSIPSQLVSGYTRILGEIDPTPHVWIASNVNGNWLLSDPTFGAGAMVNNRFVQEYNPEFLLVNPGKMIQTHMPYDPLWQFLPSPYTHEAFVSKKMNATLKHYFKHHADSLKSFLEADPAKQNQLELDRLQAQKYEYTAVVQRMNFLQQSLNISQYNDAVRLLNLISDKFNNAVGAYNSYAESFNKNQRSASNPINLSDLSKAEKLLEECSELLYTGKYPPQLMEQAKSIQQSLTEFQQKVKSAR